MGPGLDITYVIMILCTIFLSQVKYIIRDISMAGSHGTLYV